MPKISIIIPCFNSFDLMNKCLLSLENQAFKDFEVIIVDDSSTDDSYEKLLDYKTNTKLDMKVIKNVVNSGPGPTRNNGIDKVTGEYLTFLDSDDYLEENCLQLINDIIKDSQIDCVIYDYYLDTRNKQIVSKTLFNCERGNISKRDALIYSTGSTWCKVYRTDIINKNGIRFPSLKRNEDMPFNKLVIASCDSFYYCDIPLYHYVMQPNSLMHNRGFMTEKNAIEAFKIIYDKLSDEFSYEVESIFLKELLYSTVMTMIVKGYKKKDIIKHIEYWETVYPLWYKHPDITKVSRFQKLCLECIYKRQIATLRILGKVRNAGKKIFRG